MASGGRLVPNGRPFTISRQLGVGEELSAWPFGPYNRCTRLVYDITAPIGEKGVGVAGARRRELGCLVPNAGRPTC